MSELSETVRNILSDPQTSGGLLVAVSEEGVPAFEKFLLEQGLSPQCCLSFGYLQSTKTGRLITVKE